MSDKNLRSSLIRIASELQEGDDTRRKILAALSDGEPQERTAGGSAARYIQSAMKDLRKAEQGVKAGDNDAALWAIGGAVTRLGDAVDDIDMGVSGNTLSMAGEHLQRMFEA